MTQKLKIKVKETIEEKRLLNDAEREIFDIYQMAYDIKPLANEIKDFWKSQGFLYSSYDGNEGTFYKEVVRDATPDEEEAWHYLRGFETGAHGIMGGCSVIEAETTLKDKQILLEIEEEK